MTLILVIFLILRPMAVRCLEDYFWMNPQFPVICEYCGALKQYTTVEGSSGPCENCTDRLMKKIFDMKVMKRIGGEA